MTSLETGRRPCDDVDRERLPSVSYGGNGDASEEVGARRVGFDREVPSCLAKRFAARTLDARRCRMLLVGRELVRKADKRIATIS
jgi:hypothetical protein